MARSAAVGVRRTSKTLLRLRTRSLASRECSSCVARMSRGRRGGSGRWRSARRARRALDEGGVEPSATSFGPRSSRGPAAREGHRAGGRCGRGGGATRRARRARRDRHARRGGDRRGVTELRLAVGGDARGRRGHEQVNVARAGRRRTRRGRALRFARGPRAARCAGLKDDPAEGSARRRARRARHAQAESTRGGVPSGVEAHLRQHAQRVAPRARRPGGSPARSRS